MTGISLNKDSISLPIGADETLIAAITPSNATNKAIYWMSSDPTIAKVNQNGKVVGVKVGTVNITAVSVSNGNKMATCVVKVTEDSSPAIMFKDANFEKAIRDSINKPTGDIIGSDVLSITKLSILDGNLINDISGIEYLTNLSEFTLYDSAVSDLNPLSNLTKLKLLDLGNNEITDISPLRGLSNLTVLSLSNFLPDFLASHKNQISDISALSGLTNLQSLEITSNNISNIEPLKGLRKLWILNLWDNLISSEDKITLKNALPNCTLMYL